MPKSLPFELYIKFNSYQEYVNFTQEIGDFAIDHSKYTNCNLCEKGSIHKMKTQFAHCSNPSCLEEGYLCEKQYKINTCLKSDDKYFQKRFVYTLGIQNIDIVEKKNRGLTDQVKNMIEEIIQQFELKAKRIHMKLLISEVDVMPSLKQVQRYLKYKRDLRKRFRF